MAARAPHGVRLLRQRPEERRPDRRAPIVRDIAAGEAISGMKELGFPYASRAPGRICGNDLEPYAKEFVFLSAPEVPQGKRMEHSGRLHPEFGLFSPTARLRREMRIAATSVLFGGIA